MEETKSAVWLDKREQELLVIMKLIDSFHGWDVRTGRLIIDFDKDNRIGSINISQNYRPTSPVSSSI